MQPVIYVGNNSSQFTEEFRSNPHAYRKQICILRYKVIILPYFFLKVYIGLDFDIIFTSLMVSSLAAITEDFIQESYLIHIVVGISVLNISFDISYDGTSVEEKI